MEKLIKKELLFRNLWYSYTYGFIFAALFLLCHKILGLVTGNTVILLTTLIGTKGNYFDIFRVIGIVFGIVGIMLSQWIVTECEFSNKSVRETMIKIEWLQFYISLWVLVIVILMVTCSWSLGWAICMSLSLLTGIQGNNQESKIGNRRYFLMIFVGNLQQIAAILGESMVAYLGGKSFKFRENFQIIGIILLTLFLYCLGLYIGAKLTHYLHWKVLLILPIFFGIPLMVSKNKLNRRCKV